MRKFGAEAMAGLLGAGVARGLASLQLLEPPEPLGRLFERVTAKATSREALARVGTEKATTRTQLRLLAEEVAPQPVEGADEFWKAKRIEIGMAEEHPNAVFLTVLLTHTDQVMNNGNNDVISAAEADKALASLVLQPIDIAPSLDRHQRQRHDMFASLFDEGNGIRGAIYAARREGTEVQCGVVLWVQDFPDLIETVATLRKSLGASFDLVAEGFDIIDGVRYLKDISFYGGAILLKQRAADPDTAIDNLRYGGKSIEELEEEARMSTAAKTQSETIPAPVAVAAAAVPAAVVPPPAVVPAAVTPPVAEVVAAPIIPATTPEATTLAEAQRQNARLLLDVERQELEVQKRDTLLAQRDAQIVALTARAEAAEGKLAAEAAAATRQAAVAARLASLEELVAGTEVPLFETEEARTAALAQLAELDEPHFEIFKLRTENDVLKRRPAPTVASAASMVSGTLGKGAPVSALASALNSGADAPVTADGSGSVGKELALLVSGRAIGS